jgi:hypothetical protein
MQRYSRQVTCFLALFATICFASNTALTQEDAPVQKIAHSHNSQRLCWR